MGPNIASADWQPEQVWDTGFIDAYTANLAYLAVEQYAHRLTDIDYGRTLICFSPVIQPTTVSPSLVWAHPGMPKISFPIFCNTVLELAWWHSIWRLQPSLKLKESHL